MIYCHILSILYYIKIIRNYTYHPFDTDLSDQPSDQSSRCLICLAQVGLNFLRSRTSADGKNGGLEKLDFANPLVVTNHRKTIGKP